MPKASAGGSEARLRVVDGGRREAASLVERARSGDLAAWEALYRDQFRPLLRFIAYATSDVAVAEDLVQEAFALAFVGLRGFDGRASVATWLRGIAMNLVRKHWRSRSRRSRAYSRLATIPEPDGARLDDDLVRDRRADALEAALEELPSNLREAFVLIDVQGCTAAEAATLLETTPGNVRVRATRARQRLRQSLVAAGMITTQGGPA